MYVVGIDPGKRVAYALSSGHEIYRCGLSPEGTIQERAQWLLMEVAAGLPLKDSRLLVVTERMQVYDGSRVRKTDLTTLLLEAGYLAGTLIFNWPHSDWCMPHPTDWKGQLPKTIHHQRLRDEVMLHVPAKQGLESAIPSLRHNVWDAIGLATWAAKTYRRKHAGHQRVPG